VRSRLAHPEKKGLDNGSSHFSCILAEMEMLKRELDVTAAQPSTCWTTTRWHIMQCYQVV
jgi:hypothetical protein